MLMLLHSTVKKGSVAAHVRRTAGAAITDHVHGVGSGRDGGSSRRYCQEGRRRTRPRYVMVVVMVMMVMILGTMVHQMVMVG